MISESNMADWCITRREERFQGEHWYPKSVSMKKNFLLL